MSITKAQIISVINEALEEQYVGTDCDTAIKMALCDMSNYGLLEETDDTKTLALNDTYILYPTGFKSILNIQLTSGTDIKDPLIKIPGGMDEYRQLMADSNANGLPEYYAEFDGKFFLYKPSDGVYTVKIEYIKYHPDDVNNIEFADHFANCLYYGSVYYKALLAGRDRYIANWQLRYENEKQLKSSQMNKNPFITGAY